MWGILVLACPCVLGTSEYILGNPFFGSLHISLLESVNVPNKSWRLLLGMHAKNRDLWGIYTN